MTPRPVRTSAQKHAALEARVETLTDRLERAEGRLECLETTLRAMSDASGLAIGAPCARCERSYLLLEDGMLSCPACGHAHSL